MAQTTGIGDSFSSSAGSIQRTRSLRTVRRVIGEGVAQIILFTVGLAMMGPFIWLISGSVKDKAEVFTWPPTLIPTAFHWENYYQAMTMLPFHLYFRNTIIVTVMGVLGCIVTSSMVGFGFARLRFPGRDFLFVLLLSTMMLPWIVTMIPRFIMFKAIGWVDTLYPLFVPEWFGGSPFFIFLVRQFFMTIPYELDEAARVDGASNWRIWWRILLPLSGPVVATVAIFSFINNWNDFMGPLIYLNSMEKRTVALGLANFKGLYSSEWNLMMAASTVTVVPILLLFFFAQRYFMKGIVMTGMGGR